MFNNKRKKEERKERGKGGKERRGEGRGEEGKGKLSQNETTGPITVVVSGNV